MDECSVVCACGHSHVVFVYVNVNEYVPTRSHRKPKKPRSKHKKRNSRKKEKKALSKAADSQQHQQNDFDADFDVDFGAFGGFSNSNTPAVDEKQSSASSSTPSISPFPPPPTHAQRTQHTHASASNSSSLRQTESSVDFGFGDFASALPTAAASRLAVPPPVAFTPPWKCHICASANAGASSRCVGCKHAICAVCRGGLNPAQAVRNPNAGAKSKRSKQKRKKEKKKKKERADTPEKANDSVDWGNPFGSVVSDPFAVGGDDTIDPFAAPPAQPAHTQPHTNASSDTGSSESDTESASDDYQLQQQQSRDEPALAWACHKCTMDVPSSLAQCSVCLHPRCQACAQAPRQGEASESESEFDTAPPPPAAAAAAAEGEWKGQARGDLFETTQSVVAAEDVIDPFA
jgi:hypothetical protein